LDPKCYTAMIVATHPSTEPQQASGVSYDIAVTYPNGSESVLKGVGPAVRRTNADIWPAAPGDVCMVHWSQGYEPMFLIIEPPYFEECQDTNP